MNVFKVTRLFKSQKLSILIILVWVTWHLNQLIRTSGLLSTILGLSFFDIAKKIPLFDFFILCLESTDLRMKPWPLNTFLCLQKILQKYSTFYTGRTFRCLYSKMTFSYWLILILRLKYLLKNSMEGSSDGFRLKKFLTIPTFRRKTWKLITYYLTA